MEEGEIFPIQKYVMMCVIEDIDIASGFGLKNPRQQRRFLDALAKSKHFDPLDPEKWYSISAKTIFSAVGVTFS
jgi:hypothetical protein